MSEASFAITFACSLMVLCVLERVLNAVLSFFFRASSLKQMAAQQLSVKLVDTLASCASIATTSFVRALVMLLSWWILFLVLLLLFSGAYVTYTEYPESWTGFVMFYNNNLGTWVDQYVMVPLEILDILARALLPLWNSFAWWFKVMGVQGLLPIIIKEVQLVFKLANILSSACIHIAVAITGFASSFHCHGTACLVPDFRILDVVSLMGDVKDLAILSQDMTNAVCSLFAVPLDLVVYPLTDLNFAQGVHNLANAVFQLFFVVPQVSYERCSVASDNTFKTILCTPDMEPVFNFLVAGLGSIGLAIDNWVDVALVIVQKALTGTGPTCDTIQDGYLPTFRSNAALFGQNATAIVGLTQWLYSVTDGYIAVYIGTSDLSVKSGVWPYAMNPSLGVAAITYSDSDQLDASSMSGGRTVGSLQTTSMLACNCSDTASGPEILCAILPMSGIPGPPDPYLLQILWPDAITPQQMGYCQNFDIYVHSVRWQLTRYASPPVSFGVGSVNTNLPTNDCITRGTCRGIDATIYVVPNCAASTPACASACFPFCMAARASGSANDNLILVSAERWRNGYTAFNQDCADMAASSQTGTYLKMGSSGTVSIPVPSGLTSNIPIFVSAVERRCKPATRVRSIVDKPPQMTSRIRIAGQPFVLTGETVFTQNNIGGGASSVHVERLSGDQQGILSLSTLAQDLPAEPVLEVQKNEAVKFDPDRVLLPFLYSETRQLAVSSRNYVFYVSNPALSSFAAYFEACVDFTTGTLPKLGFLIDSSYSGLFIYRVRAYEQCSTYSCGPNLVKRVQLEGFDRSFESTCDKRFNATITDMEYINEDNIAIVVLVTIPKEFDVTMGTARGAATSYQTYWLNPASMVLSATVFQTSVMAGSYGSLCPAMQRLPRVGTFAVEVLNMGVFAIKWAFNAILYTPGMAKVWADGGMCPAIGATYHHSVLVNCGENLFSLDDFFDSYDDAASVFWHGLAVLAQFVTGSTPATGSTNNPVANVLDGMALYGESKIDFFSASFAVMTMAKIPVADQANNLWATVIGTAGSGEGVVQGSLYISTATITLARFSYKALSIIALTLTKSILQSSQLTQSAIWQITWNALYGLQSEFTSTVLARSQLGCAGLRLMFDLENPWAKLVYYQCAAGAELYNDLFQLAMTIVVDVPMVVCVCKESRGHNLRTFLAQTCAPRLPLTLQPLLYTMATTMSGSGSGLVQTTLACDTVLAYTSSSITASMEPWFSYQFDALTAMSSSVDYAMAPFDSKAGQCLNYLSDAHVIVIVPQPVDYFVRCAKTKLCQAKCSKEWTQFQNQTIAPIDTPYVTVDMESMFFPGEVDLNKFVNNVTAVTEVNGTGLCVDHTPSDMAVALAEFGSSGMGVQVWCIPLAAGVSVYQASTGGFNAKPLPGDVMAVQFISDSRLVLLLRVASYNNLYLLDGTMTVPQALPDLANYVALPYYIVRIVNIWPVMGNLIVDVIVRSFQNDNTGPSSVAQVQNYEYFGGTNSPWRITQIDLSNFAGNYWFFGLQSGAHLFLPKISGLPAYSVYFDKSGYRDGIVITGSGAPSPAAEYSGIDFQSTMNNYIFSSNSLGSDYVFAVSPNGWDWLSQVRLSGSATSAYNSIAATAQLQVAGSCNSQTCSGCQDIVTQRLCLAYGTCALMNCVGTPVNMKRPLCGIGQLLSHHGEIYLLSIKGGWDVFTEILNDALKLSLEKTAGLDIAFPEEEFTGLVCTAKDSSAEFFSVLTSMINTALQLGNARVGYMYDGATNVDTNSDAMLTLTMTSVTSFLNQLALFPVYSMIVSYQIYMCPVNGMLGIMDITSFKIRIQSVALSSPADFVAGQCLTISQVTMAGYPDTSTSSSRLATSMQTTLINVVNLYLIQSLEPYLHIFDGICTYMIGVIQAMGTMIESQHMALCNPPNYFLSDMTKCACGDTALIIPEQPDTVGMNLWCTGTLSMLDGANNEIIIYNPYTYQELQAMASGMDTYLACASQSYNCQTPYDSPPSGVSIFNLQGVTLINVLVKCRDNYINMQWDSAAYVLFNTSLHYLVQYNIPKQASTCRGASHCNAAICLMQNANIGASNTGCLDDFLGSAEINPDFYWYYNRNSRASGSQYVDACVAFTGPASLNLTRFSDCVDGTDNQNCILAHHIWSPDSANAVSVARPHKVWYHGVYQDSLVQKLYREAHDLVTSSIQLALTHWMSNSSEVSFQVFSSEGDVVHQILDCIFMGPYARVDYWPIPQCLANEECLNGPFWARDTNSGQSRNVDPINCIKSTSHTLPYSCGSPARQSVIKYFVKNMLSQSNTGGGSIIKVAVLEQLHQFMDIWGDATEYSCLCPNNVTHSPQCCVNQADSGFLPSNLNVTVMDLNNSNVLQAMDDHFYNLYSMAIQNRDPWLSYLQSVTPGEFGTYDWSRSKRAQDEARFTPKKVLYNYTSDKAASPLKDADNTLWGICHATLKQVFLTMPIKLDGNISFGATVAPDGTIISDSVSYDMLAYDGNPDGLEGYVAALAHQAFLDSPLYRHYHPSHKPSESILCADLPNSPDMAPDFPNSPNMAPDFPNKPWNAISLGGTAPLSSPEPVDVYDYRKFSLGINSCLCGWQRLDARRCLPPPGQVCSTVPGLWCDSQGAYNIDQEHLLLDFFSTTWTCPETDLSSTWGFLDPIASEQWLNGSTSIPLNFEELLRAGRAGVKYGNIITLKNQNQGKAAINPTRRKIPLENAKLHTCGRDHANATTLAAHFVDNLFPMAQGLDEAGATAYCLRYIIEVARLQALKITSENSQDTVQQALVVATWRSRCGSQLQLLHLCVSLNVFTPPSSTSFQPFFVQCKHFQSISQAGMYTTPECLLNVAGVFYDPCRCISCVGDQNTDLTTMMDVVTSTSCKIRFDPRTMLRQAPAGYWSQDVADDLNAFWSDPASLLLDSFTHDVLEDPDATGNTASGQHWAYSEGPMEDNSEFCDMIQDYWPEDWLFPIGYHVTVPCSQDDTAYRSFQQSFGLEFDEDNLPVMTFKNDLLRDASLADTNFGSMGLCRASNMGMPMVETNTMRYCTSTPLGETEDYTMPITASQTPDTNTRWSDYVCTSDSTQLPWPDSAQNPFGVDSALHSVGTVPNMPATLMGDQYYPNNLDLDTWALGPVQELTRDKGWGAGCSDFDLTLCQTDLNCSSTVADESFRCMGKICTLTSTPCDTDSNCVGTSNLCRGVCMSAMVKCLKHSDCTGETMCTGDGQCVTPVLSVQNNLLKDDIGFRVYAQNQCADTMEEYSMVGGSYWGQTSVDILRLHGLCSYEDWYKYQYTLDTCGQGRTNGSSSFDVDPTQCNYLNLRVDNNNLSKWWEASGPRPSVMYMRPSQCDRDYERLEGFKSCKPLSHKNEDLNPYAYIKEDITSFLDYDIEFDKYVKTHVGADTPQKGPVRVPIAVMPDLDKKYGFLGLDGINDESQIQSKNFEPCSQIHQCYAAPFNISGRNSTRMYLSNTIQKEYNVKWTFVCGAIGIQLSSGLCQLDLDVLPLYRYMCHPDHTLASVSLIITPALLNQLCSRIKLEYSPSYANILTNLEGLTALFYAFPAILEFTTYLNVVDFAYDMYDNMQQSSTLYKSLYYPFTFSLFEVPLDWFFQCILMQGTLTIDESSTNSQDCVAYTDRARHQYRSYNTIKPGGDDLLTFLRFVRAGYRRSTILEYEQQYMSHAIIVLSKSIENVIEDVYGDGLDYSYQQCSRRLVWAVGDNDPRLYNPILRAMVEMYYSKNTCSAWLTDLVASLKEYGISSGNWIDYMTVPDSDPIQLLPQRGGLAGNTLLNILNNSVISQFGYKTSKLITGISGVQPQDSTPYSPLYLDFTVPPGLPSSWVPVNADPVSQPSNPYLVTDYDKAYPFVCVYDDPNDDPLLTYYAHNDNVYKCYTKNPTNITDGVVSYINFCIGKDNRQVNCTMVPKYYQTEGVFMCRYTSKPSGNTVSKTQTVLTKCDETMPGCGDVVFRDLYNRVYSYYQPVTPEPLDPEVFPWFTSPDDWGFTFNLRGILNYQLNIQPDTQTTVMCSITDPQEAIAFYNCTNKNYEALKRHAMEHYVHDGAVKVPHTKQLEWKVTRSFLSDGTILAYANTNRPINETFMFGLFDDASVCTGRTSSNFRMCHRSVNESTAWTSINPWTLGYWNPFEGCDVDFQGPNQGNSEYVSSYCAANVCPSGGPFYQNMPFGITPNDDGKTCNAKNNKRTSTPGVPPFDTSIQSYTVYNLCQHTVIQDPIGCMHDQSLLGGYDGVPAVSNSETTEFMTANTQWANLNYTIATNMYDPSTWEIPNALRGGLFAGTNPLWSGSTNTPFGFIRVPQGELGITRIGLSVSRGENDTISTFAIQKLPLTANGIEKILSQLEDKYNSTDVSNWVPILQATLQMEHIANTAFVGVGVYSNNQIAASCPLKRFALYDGGYSAFSPPMPSPKRAQYLFGSITNNRLVHPTMSRTADGAILGSYNTSNGFCYCPNVKGVPQVQCQISISSAETCSLIETIRSLRANPTDDMVYYSHVFPPHDYKYTVNLCTMQLDWPFLNNSLRDGSIPPLNDQANAGASQSYNPADNTPLKCHVLDRFKPFRYKYKSSTEALKDPGFNTVQRGTCRLGRVVSLDPTVIPDTWGRCTRDQLDYSKASFKCIHGTTQLNIRVRLTPEQTFARKQNSTRRRCNTCTRPPRFQTEQGNPMVNESSFGRPFRKSTEKVLAGGLYDTLCKSPGGCPLLNASAWKPGQFLRNYLTTPWYLFLNTTARPTQANTPVRDDADKWTDHNWIYCPDSESLKTGVGCKGHMTKEQWRTGKATICPHMIKALSSQGGHDPLVKTSFCNLDTYTADVCQAILTAKMLVYKANCIAAGNFECLPSPFVYHPASFNKNNQDWVHQTVQDYYLQVDSRSCTLSENLTAQLAYNIKFQQNCPANTVVFFEDIVKIVRTVVTEAVVITARLMGMLVKLLGMLSPDPAAKALYKQSFINDWVWIKAQARATSSSLSDTIFDMLMDSGPIGKNLMSFFLKTCNSVNTLYNWVLNVWCNFVETHMIRLMTSLKTAIGFIATGFSFLQDFADNMFQGALPATFVAKYGTSAFQRVMSEYYSQPTAHKDTAGTKVPVTANMVAKDTAATAKVARGTSNAVRTTGNVVASVSMFSRLGKAVPYLGAAAMAVDVGLSVYQAVDLAMRLSSFYPDNFTLFNWQDIINVIDDMEQFLVHDETCFEFTVREGYGFQTNLSNCFAYKLVDAAALARAAQLFEPTLCWADSSQSLGHSNLFSCSSSSTCCADEFCTSQVTCYNCPTPLFEGANKFGCNALITKCMCGVVPQVFTQCSSNSECGASSQCVLISSLNSISYGTIPCSKCPTHNVVCLVPTTGFPAQCSCLMEQTVAYDICTDNSGQITSTNPNKLCAYTPRATGSTSTWVWHLEELMVIPCIQTYTAVCSLVYIGGNQFMMPVAISIRSNSHSTSRRLLVEEQVISESAPAFHSYQSEYELVETEALHSLLMDSHWNLTAAPCSTLAEAYQSNVTLSILETFTLHRCAFWRFVGRRVLQAHNLTHIIPQETFLLSVDDFSAAIAQKDNLMVLARNPGVFLKAFMYHPWLKPVRAIATVIANTLEQVHWADAAAEDAWDYVMGEEEPSLLERQEDLLKTVKDSPFQANMSQIFKVAPHLEVKIKRQLNASQRLTSSKPIMNSTRGTGGSKPIMNSAREKGGKPIMTGKTGSRDTNSTREKGGKPIMTGKTGGRGTNSTREKGRKLLQSSISAARQELLRVQGYSANIATGSKQAPNQVIVQQSWVAGSGTWPPKYDFSLQSCPLGEVTLKITLDVITILGVYYDHIDTPQKPVDRSFRNALPRIAWAYNQTKVQTKTWASWFFHSAFSLAGVNPAQALKFFTGPNTSPWSLQWILGTAIYCDLPSVLSCNNHTRDLFMSSIVFLIFYILLAIITSSLGIPVFSTLFFLSYPTFILWYVYGMAPTCIPLLPTCLFEDIIVAGKALLPLHIWLPKRLLCYPEQYNQTFNQTCLRPCEDLNFTSWKDPIAFTLCNIDKGFCLNLTNTSTGSTQADNVLEPFLAPLKQALMEKHDIITRGQDLDAYRTCTYVTGITALPFFAGILFVIMFLTSAVVGVLQVMPPLVSLWAQAIAYHSTPHE